MPTPNPTSTARSEPRTVNITKSFVSSLKMPAPGASRVNHWDGRIKGFGVRVYASGRIAYVLQYRMEGRGPTRTFTIGTHGSPWTPEGARRRALDLLESVRRGVDPGAARVGNAGDAEGAASALHDFDAFLDRYLALHVLANGLRSLKDIQGTFDRDVRPAFRGRSVLEITKQDVKDMRTRIGERSRSAANKAHKWLNAAFMWGIEHDVLEASPMIALSRPFPEPARQRRLADWEVALVWSVLVHVNAHFAMLVRMLIVTGQRLREVAGIAWEEIDLERGEWMIPGSRTKNKQVHMVPISTLFRRLLEAVQPDPLLRSGLLLTTTGTTPISGFSKVKELMDELVAGALADPMWRRHRDFAPWVLHDCRRTFSTGCGELRIPIQHAEAVLNHRSGVNGDGVARTYWLYEYAREKRAALQKWSDRVERVLVRHGVGLLPAADRPLDGCDPGQQLPHPVDRLRASSLRVGKPLG